MHAGKPCIRVWFAFGLSLFTLLSAASLTYAQSSGPLFYRTGVKYRGINRAGLEFGSDWDGWSGQDFYQQPNVATAQAEVAYYKAKGMNVVRLPISWERLQYTLGGELNPAYLTLVRNYVGVATAAGLSVVVDLHNYNRYAEGAHDATGIEQPGTQRVIGDGTLTINHVIDVWKKLWQALGNDPAIILGLMNEPHEFPSATNLMSPTDWFANVQTLINALRAAGSTQLILVPNSRGWEVEPWSVTPPGGGDSIAAAALHITDPASNYAFDIHAYLRNPANSYVQLVSEVTTWAETNHRRLFLSEMGMTKGEPTGMREVGALLDYMNTHNSVWLGWTPWDLQYEITRSIAGSQFNTTDGPSMPWYAPYWNPTLLSSGAPVPAATPWSGLLLAAACLGIALSSRRLRGSGRRARESV